MRCKKCPLQARLYKGCSSNYRLYRSAPIFMATNFCWSQSFNTTAGEQAGWWCDTRCVWYMVTSQASSETVCRPGRSTDVQDSPCYPRWLMLVTSPTPPHRRRPRSRCRRWCRPRGWHCRAPSAGGRRGGRPCRACNATSVTTSTLTGTGMVIQQRQTSKYYTNKAYYKSKYIWSRRIYLINLMLVKKKKYDYYSVTTSEKKTSYFDQEKITTACPTFRQSRWSWT